MTLLLLCTLDFSVAQTGTYTFSTASDLGASITETVGTALLTVTFNGGTGADITSGYDGWGGCSGNTVYNNPPASTGMVLLFDKPVTITSLRLADGAGSTTQNFVLTPTPAGTPVVVTVPADDGVAATLGASFQNITQITITPQSGGSTYYILDDVVLQSVLPVELTSFTAAAVKNTILLHWATATERNNFGFDVERSANPGVNAEWKTIGFVQGSGNSSAPKQYRFVDKAAASGTHSYRLKQIDNDGQYEYSPVIEAVTAAPASIALHQNFPNPFNPSTTITFELAARSSVTLRIFDVLGREQATVVQGVLEAGVHAAAFDAKDLASGAYVYRLEISDAGGVHPSLTRAMLLVR